MSLYPLTIGNVTLDQGPFEGPDGSKGGLSDLGSKQKAVVREFPGGIISAQLYGSFPKAITWSGRLYGGNAINRSFELQRLCDDGDLITFTWAQWIYDGFVEDYKPTIRAFNVIDYDIIFRPLYNASTVGGGGQQNSDPFSSSVANAQDTMRQQTQSPASGATMPDDVEKAIAELDQSLLDAMDQSGQTVATVPQATASALSKQIINLQGQLSVYVNDPSNPLLSSAAADLSATLGVIGAAFASSTLQIITTIQALNPNLYRLAQQYYDDPALFWVIARANNLSDPLPVTDGPIPLVIPVKPQLDPEINYTVLHGSTKT